MNCIIPFESRVKFDYPVKEICSISLEHEITKNDDELLGNFFISGTYKEHELSVNTNDYQFTIPFSLEYTNRINPDTLEFNINDFTYELDNNELIINIKYELKADDLKEDSPYDLIDRDYEEDVKEDIIIEPLPEDNKTNNEVSKEISNIKLDDDYILYHVHYLKIGETIDSISSLYKIEKEDILNINNVDIIDGLNALLIPLKDE